MSNSRVYRALDTNMHARAGIFGGGLLGDPLSDLPIVGGLSSVLSPVLTAISLPGASTSTTAATTSVKTTSTVALTTSSTAATATSTSATSTSTSVATSAASTSSTASATSTSTSSATSTSTQAVSDTAAATSTAPPAPSNTETSASLTSSSTSSSASASASVAADTANAPKGFLANKALSVGVITAASLVGLVLIIAIATWAIRKRKNDRIDRDILDFSTAANLMHDTEKGAGAGGSGSIEAASSTGHGSSSSHGTLSLGPMETSRGMYENRGYPAAAPAYIPRNQPSRMANPYPAQQQPAYNTYAFPSQEQSNTTYGGWNNYGAYGNGNGGAMQAQNNQFDQAYSGTEDPYGGIAYDAPQQNGAMAGVGAGAQGQGPVRRPSAHRKPPPQLYIAPNPISEAVVTSAPSPVGAQPMRRTSLLNSPVVEGAPRERKDTLTHVELLDPSAPKVPAASPRLPDEFGRLASVPASKDSPVEQPVRRLVVRNE
ncbi:hypothetical protein VTO73DRAFT_9436 [Trametes versicolor]